MNLHYILDADNRPIAVDSMQWAEWLGQDQLRRFVDRTELTADITVSTVFLGINHRFLGGGPPLLFETMIFGGRLDQCQWRYSSWDDAKTGHAMAVKRARQAMENPDDPRTA